MAGVVTSTKEINSGWLTEALRESGSLKSSVKSVVVERIAEGVGLMAELARLHIEYEKDEDLPATMIAKCAAQNENKGVAQLLDFYNRETNFYQRIGRNCPFRVPDSYYGAVNQETYDFVLLMEDMGNVAPNDQITGSSEQEAFAKIDAIAKLHANYWEKVRQPENSWMYDFMCPEERQKLRDFLFLPSLQPAIDKFEPHFSGAARAMCQRVGDQYIELFSKMSPSAYTFIHGDYRQDNFIYKQGTNESVTMDWQISGAGHGAFDVTYFVCQSLTTDLRRRIERPLFERYVEGLKAAGVSGYEVDTAWQDYRLFTLFCLIYPVTVCGSLDLGNERGRALAECMLTRNLTVIEDLKSAELLD